MSSDGEAPTEEIIANRDTESPEGVVSDVALPSHSNPEQDQNGKDSPDGRTGSPEPLLSQKAQDEEPLTEDAVVLKNDQNLEKVDSGKPEKLEKNNVQEVVVEQQ